MKLSYYFSTAWNNYVNHHLTDHDFERDQEGDIKQYYVQLICNEMDTKIKNKRADILQSARDYQKIAEEYVHSGYGWTADVYEAASSFLKMYAGKRENDNTSAWEEWKIWTIRDEHIPFFSSAKDVVNWLHDQPAYCKRLALQHLKKCASGWWSSSYASWDGQPYQYDNGPWPKQDHFFQFADGTVGVIWDYNGHISAHIG